jgi:hypothetical protein
MVERRKRWSAAISSTTSFLSGTRLLNICFSSGCHTMTPSLSTRNGVRASPTRAPARMLPMGSARMRTTTAPITVRPSDENTGRE